MLRKEPPNGLQGLALSRGLGEAVQPEKSGNIYDVRF